MFAWIPVDKQTASARCGDCVIQVFVSRDWKLGLKKLVFRGDSLAELKSFPASARKVAGRQLELVQMGRDPADWKPMTTIGAGVREIRLRDDNGIYRVVYVAKFAERIFVLHCFQKKSQKTLKSNIDLASRRYRELLREYSQ
jgi:phage-related protein